MWWMFLISWCIYGLPNTWYLTSSSFFLHHNQTLINNLRTRRRKRKRRRSPRSDLIIEHSKFIVDAIPLMVMGTVRRQVVPERLPVLKLTYIKKVWEKVRLVSPCNKLHIIIMSKCQVWVDRDTGSDASTGRFTPTCTCEERSFNRPSMLLTPSIFQ